MDQNELKRSVAKRTAEIIFTGEGDPLCLGVGTGSTVDYFIAELQFHKKQISVAVSSSARSSRQLRDLAINVVAADTVSGVEVYVDGADEVGPDFALTKGGGGAHTQEKIVASIADQFICIVDESKVVSGLGQFPIPVEVIHSAINSVIRQLGAMGGRAVPRDGFTTDNGHGILDIHGLTVENPDELEQAINNIPGVVEVGIFARDRPQRVIVGGSDGVYELTR